MIAICSMMCSPFLLYQQASPDVKTDQCGFPKHLKPQTTHIGNPTPPWALLASHADIMIMVVIIDDKYWATGVSIDTAHLLQPTIQLERFILVNFHSMGSRNGQSRLILIILIITANYHRLR